MRLALAFLFAALAAGPVHGQTISPMTGTTAAPPARPAQPAARAPRMKLQDRFAAANTTHDGKLTLDQARDAKMTSIVRRFDAIDAGRKGYVTLSDIRAYNRAQRAARTTTR